jgi:hypothetical protein
MLRAARSKQNKSKTRKCRSLSVCAFPNSQCSTCWYNYQRHSAVSFVEYHCCSLPSTLSKMLQRHLHLCSLLLPATPKLHDN